MSAPDWDVDQVVGHAEIAEALGVSVATVKQWRARALGFPEPTDVLAMGPVWYWGPVRRWAEKTGRLPVTGAR